MKRLPTSLRRLRSLKGKRLAAVAALSTAIVAGIVIGAMASIGGAAAPKNALARAKSVDDVVAQVRQSFGDHQLVSASVEGSLLSVTVNLPSTSTTPGYGVKGVFEGQVLGHAVADWMRADGQQPITSVRYRDTRGRVILGTPLNGDPVESDPNVSPLAANSCEAAAKAVSAGSLALVSALTLPYINGTCVFTFQAADLQAGSQAAMGALQQIIPAIGGPPNERPWLFELDNQNGVAKTGAAWMPGDGGTTWATPGLAYPLAHG
jgi:hypothetical protein